MKILNTMYTYATCYESEMRYPTDMKLLWECSQKTYATLSVASQRMHIVRQGLARIMATAMEGSFGTQKEHYNLHRVKARRKATEFFYIFFGIHTANLVHLAERLKE